MIRDANKIYGERNDPNTVTADGTLADGNLMVGAGNKKIKPLTVSGKSLLYTDGSKVLNSFPYGTPNKQIGTDASGNLALLDIVKPIQRFNWAKNGMAQALFEGAAAKYLQTNVTTYSDTGGTVVAMTKTGGGELSLFQMTIEFTEPLDVNALGIAGKTGHLNICAACPFMSIKQIFWYCKNSAGQTQTEEIVNKTPIADNQGIFYSGEVTIPTMPIYGFALYPTERLPDTLSNQAFILLAELEWEE